MCQLSGPAFIYGPGNGSQRATNVVLVVLVGFGVVIRFSMYENLSISQPIAVKLRMRLVTILFTIAPCRICKLSPNFESINWLTQQQLQQRRAIQQCPHVPHRIVTASDDT